MGVTDDALDPRFRAFLEVAPDAIVVIDEEGRIVAVNALAEAMFCYHRDELLGGPVEVLVPDRFHEPHQKHRDGYIAAPCTRTMGRGRERELRGRRRNGDEFPVQISLSPLETAQQVLIISIIRDVTNNPQFDFAAYVRSHGELLFQSFGVEPGAIRLQVEGRDVFLATDIAVPCGLIVHELLSNSLRHAFPEGRGTIRVRLERAADDLCVLTIGDDGRSLPPETHGLRLVRGLVQQIEGTMEVSAGDGTEYRIAFPRERRG